MTQTFQAHASDISCEGCANAIKRSLGSLPGVLHVAVDVPAKNVTVEHDAAQLNENAIRARLEKAGYPVK